MRPRALRACLAAIVGSTALTFSGLAFAQQVQPNWWVTDAPVTASARIGNTLYIGGPFTSIGPNIGGGVPVDASAGNRTVGFPVANGNVLSAAPDGAGGWFVGGAFDSLGGMPRSHVGHVLADLSVDSWNPGANGDVKSIVLDGSTLYLGGSFNQVAGQTRAGVAAVDAASGVLSAWNPAVPGTVNAILVKGGLVYVGGTFTTVGGLTRPRLAAIDPVTAAPTSWAPNPGAEVYSLAAQDSILYVGGTFTTIGGQPRTGLAAIDLATMLVTAWNPGRRAHAMVLTPTTMYICGTFAGGMKEISLSTGDVTAWNPNVSNGSAVYSIAKSGSTIYAGGNFVTMGGQPRVFAASVDASSGAVQSWNPRPNGIVRRLVANGSSIFLGGEFQTVNPLERPGLAAIDVATGEATDWNPSPDGAVHAVTAGAGGMVYVGGEFTQIDGAERQRLAAFNALTGDLTSWDPRCVGTAVYAIDAAGSPIYVGGNFFALGGQPRLCLGAVSPTTGLGTSWNPGANAAVRAVARGEGVIYAGGEFDNLGGQARARLGAVDEGTGLATSWNPSLTHDQFVFPVALAILPIGARVYVGGVFTHVAGFPRTGAAAIDTGTAVPAAGLNTNGTVRAFAISGGALYMGGDFTYVVSQFSEYRPYLAKIDPGTGLFTGTQVDPNSSVYSLSEYGASLYAGGTFNRISGASARGIAAISTSGTVGVEPRAAALDALSVLPSLPNPAAARADLRFSLAQAGRVSVEVIDIAGRRVRAVLEGATLPAGVHSVGFERGALSSGLYFVRVTTPRASATGKLVIVP